MGEAPSLAFQFLAEPIVFSGEVTVAFDPDLGCGVGYFDDQTLASRTVLGAGAFFADPADAARAVLCVIPGVHSAQVRAYPINGEQWDSLTVLVGGSAAQIIQVGYV